MNNLVHAYLGDAVYELYIREFLINSKLSKVKELQKESIKYVSAVSQSSILDKLISNNYLSNEEIDIVKRGRNSKSHMSKTTDIITYKKSTGLECLIGYLYLNNKDRCYEILEIIVGEIC